jgi:Transposase
MMHEERRWFVGIDWASQEHVVSLCDGKGKKIGQRKFAHGGTGLSDMMAWLLKASGGEAREIHVAIETSHGPIVEALLERGFNVYSINPKQLDRFRDRFTVAGVKDDSLDADVLADSLRTDTKAVPQAQRRRTSRCRAQRVVAHRRGAQGGARPPDQPSAGSALALLSSDAAFVPCVSHGAAVVRHFPHCIQSPVAFMALGPSIRGIL